MKAKKLISLVLALAVVASCACIGFVNASAVSEYNEYEKMLESIKPENNYGLEDTVNDGKIIQAWNWSYKNIIDNLELLAEQGFTTIQVSPPNEIKMPTKDVKVCEPVKNGVAPNGWWMFYQPAGFQLNESTDNALGVKSEFKEMVNKAHELGLKVIVDAVINHFGTDDDHKGLYTNDSVDPMDHVNSRAAEFEPEILAAKALHSPWKDMTYVENLGQAMRQYDSTGKPLRDSKGDFVYGGSATEYDIEESLTQHCTSGLPDLDTSKPVVQKAIYDYFVELVDECDVDGFRFDAAKHIETRYDTYFASDFWDNTLIKLRSEYPDKEIYAYGEILNKCGDGRPFSEYTELMDVTDSSSYWGIKDAVLTGGGNPIPFYGSEYEGTDPTTVNFTKENVIQWNESHDTYIDGGTSSLTVQQRNKIWALTAARQTITGIYFARPDDRTGANRAAIEAICANITLGDANKTSWTAPEVAAVNQFDNYFQDAPEYNSNQNKVVMIERGGLGATLVNLTGTTKAVELSVYTLSPGTYKDAITGNEFTVSGGKVTGKIGSTGIACIYYAQDTEPEVPEEPVITNPYDIDVTGSPFPQVDGYNTVVYSAKQNWTEAYVYAWITDTDINNDPWPGTPMKKVTDDNGFGEKQYIAYIPVEYENYIINNGKGNNDAGGAQTVDLTVTSSVGMYMDKQGTDGKWTIGNWDPEFYPVVLGGGDEDPTDPPVDPTDPEDTTTEETEPTTTTEATEPTTEATEPSTGATEPTTTTEATEPSTGATTAPIEPAPTTPDESEPITTKPSEPEATTTVPGTTVGEPEGYILGDADGNGKINIKDATVIQKYVAKMDVEIDLDAALANGATYLSVKDATIIQKFLAKMLPEDTLVGKFVER